MYFILSYVFYVIVAVCRHFCGVCMCAGEGIGKPQEPDAA